MSGDMKFLGIFTIVIGSISCLTIVGAVIGIPYIIAGMRLKESGEMFRSFLEFNSQEFMEKALEKESRYFFIQKVIAIVTIILMIVYIVLFIVLISFFMNEFKSGIIHST
jgi:flagellar biosynthesis protein FlhB